jgi:phosphate transport system protein
MGKHLLIMFDQIIEIYSKYSDKLTKEQAEAFQNQFSEEDDFIDSLFKETLNQLVKKIQKEIDSKKQAKLMTETLLMVRHMERIGDHLCNIAEKILYIETGNHFHIS